VNELTIGELSERSGVATSAIRYYEDRGLVASRRTTGNQRRYPRAMLRRLAFVRTAQRVGLSLEEIETALSTLPSNRTPTKADWTRLSRAWRPRLDAQIRQLERARAAGALPPVPSDEATHRLLPVVAGTHSTSYSFLQTLPAGTAAAR